MTKSNKLGNLKSKLKEHVFDMLIVATLIFIATYFILGNLNSFEIVKNISKMREYESMISFIIAAISTITFGFVGKALYIKSSNKNSESSELNSDFSNSAGTTWIAAAFLCWVANTFFDQLIKSNLSLDIFFLIANSCYSTLNNMFLLFAVSEIRFLSHEDYPIWWENKLNSWFRKKKNIILTTFVFLISEVTLGLAFQNVKYISRIPDNVYSAITVFYLIKYLSVVFQKRGFLHFDKFTVLVLIIGFIVQFQDYFPSTNYPIINEAFSLLVIVFHICLPFVMIMWLTSWWKERTTSQQSELIKKNDELTSQKEKLKYNFVKLSNQSNELIAKEKQLTSTINALQSAIDHNKEKTIIEWIDIYSQYFRATSNIDYIFFVMIKEKSENILKRFAHYENGEKIESGGAFLISDYHNKPSPTFGVDCFRKQKILYFKTSADQDFYIQNNSLNRKVTVELKRCDQSIFWPIVYPFDNHEYLDRTEIENGKALNFNSDRKILGVISYQQNAEISEEQIRMLNQYAQLIGKKLYDEYYKNDPFEFVKNILRLRNVEDLHDFASSDKLPKQYELLKDLYLKIEDDLKDHFFGLKGNQTKSAKGVQWAEDHILNESFKGVQNNKLSLFMAAIACSAAIERTCFDKKIEAPSYLKNELYNLSQNESLSPNDWAHKFIRTQSIIKDLSSRVEDVFNQIYKFTTIICFDKQKIKCDMVNAKISFTKDDSQWEITLEKSQSDIQNIYEKIRSIENADLTSIQGDFAAAYFMLKKTLADNFSFTHKEREITFIFKN
jgi:hypothetical protein